MKVKILFLLLVSYSLTGRVVAQKLDTMAQEFLQTLSPELQKKALFTLNDAERFNFNFVPIARKGPTFQDFNETQKTAALKLLRASLSQEGYRKTSEIMALENVLLVLENDRLKMPDGSSMRDALNYHFSIFGKPTNTGFWGWRFEGHHLSLNFVAETGNIIASTPSFMGSNPAIVPSGEHKGKEVLKQETDRRLALVNSLSEAQLKIARFSDIAPREIFTTNQRKVTDMDHKGIAYSVLTKNQKEIFLQLLNVYLDNYESQFSSALRSKIQMADYENLSFAWAGSLKKGNGHYYNIQGPTLLIEYDNTQNNANHVHTVVRDLTNDFGEDLLQQHYNEHHKK